LDFSEETRIMPKLHHKLLVPSPQGDWANLVTLNGRDFLVLAVRRIKRSTSA
jgi:hypothetical protein